MTVSGRPAPAPWPDLVWRGCRFDELDVGELQGIHRARQRVFVVEQACAFLDADGYDEAAFHLAAWSPSDSDPLAYARILAPGAKYAEASIGRVLTARSARGHGLGRDLVGRAIKHARTAWPLMAIRIAAQSRLRAFYAGFGFAAVGDTFMEDGILHTEMLLPPPPSA